MYELCIQCIQHNVRMKRERMIQWKPNRYVFCFVILDDGADGYNTSKNDHIKPYTFVQTFKLLIWWPLCKAYARYLEMYNNLLTIFEVNFLYGPTTNDCAIYSPIFNQFDRVLIDKNILSLEKSKLSIKIQRKEKKEKKSKYRFSDHTQFKVHLQLLA